MASSISLAARWTHGTVCVDFSRGRGLSPPFAVKLCKSTRRCRRPTAAVIAPGHFAIEDDRLLLGFAHDTALEVQELQLEGKKRMNAKDFINGYRPRSDEALGTPQS